MMKRMTSINEVISGAVRPLHGEGVVCPTLCVLCMILVQFCPPSQSMAVILPLMEPPLVKQMGTRSRYLSHMLTVSSPSHP